MRITKTFLLVSVIFILALAVRLISAHYVDVGSDEMIYQLIPWNIISAERLSTVEQAPVYFYLTDLGYKVAGGLTPVTGRLPSIFFGAAAVVLVFLISRQLFEQRTAALISALLFALSGFAIRYNQEMDMTAYFLVLLSMLFLVQFLKEDKDWKLYTGAIFLALAVLAKPIVLLFVPAYAAVWLAAGYRKQGLLYRDGEKKVVVGKKSAKMALIALLICVLVAAPVLVYNYSLYTEKGFTDYYFTVLAGIGNGGGYQGQEPAPWTFSTFRGVLESLGSSLLRLDALLFICGLLGMMFAFRTPKKIPGVYGVYLLALSTIFLLLYLAGKMGSSTHYVWLPLVLSVFAGFGLMKAYEYWLRKYWPQVRWQYVVAAVVVLAAINAVWVL